MMHLVNYYALWTGMNLHIFVVINMKWIFFPATSTWIKHVISNGIQSWTCEFGFIGCYDNVYIQFCVRNVVWYTKFILKCFDDVWHSHKNVKLIHFPENLKQHGKNVVITNSNWNISLFFWLASLFSFVLVPC